MKTRLIVVMVIVLGLLVAAAPVFATSGAHFSSASDSINSSGALVATFTEAGLGNATVNYTLTAESTAVYGCINNGGNHPKASNKTAFAGPVSGNGTFSAPKNGKLSGSVEAGPIASTLTCPSGQHQALVSVSYTNVVLTDTTNNVSVDLADVSRTFFQ